MLAVSASKTRSAVERVAAKSGQLEERITIEVGKLLEDVRAALSCDMRTATRAAGRLAALLASRPPQDPRATPARGGLAPWQKRKVQNHIEGELEGPLFIEDLAKLVSLSSSYFCRSFKKSFGEPPHTYIVKMRVGQARTLMLTTSEGLSQIALACGFTDQSHLCRCFRQVTGTTPGAWRRTHATGPQSPGLVTTVNQPSFGSHRHPFSGDVAIGSWRPALPT
jgi:AraC-like DNA-binding protein